MRNTEQRFLEAGFQIPENQEARILNRHGHPAHLGGFIAIKPSSAAAGSAVDITSRYQRVEPPHSNGKGPQLNERQNIALALLCQNESHKVIGKALGLSHKGTVRKIVRSIFQAFGLRPDTRTQRYALITIAAQLYPQMRVNTLTEEEKQMVILMAKGYVRSGAIAQQRRINESLVRRRVRSIVKKLGITKRLRGSVLIEEILRVMRERHLLHSAPEGVSHLTRVQIQALMLRGRGWSFERINKELSITHSDVICSPSFLNKRLKMKGAGISLKAGKHTEPYATSLRAIQGLQRHGQLVRAMDLSGLLRKVKQERFGFEKINALRLLARGYSIPAIMELQNRSSYPALHRLLAQAAEMLGCSIAISKKTDFLPLLRKARKQGLISGVLTVEELDQEIEGAIEAQIAVTEVTRDKVLQDIEGEARREDDEITLATVSRYRAWSSRMIHEISVDAAASAVKEMFAGQNHVASPECNMGNGSSAVERYGPGEVTGDSCTDDLRARFRSAYKNSGIHFSLSIHFGPNGVCCDEDRMLTKDDPRTLLAIADWDIKGWIRYRHIDNVLKINHMRVRRRIPDLDTLLILNVLHRYPNEDRLFFSRTIALSRINLLPRLHEWGIIRCIPEGKTLTGIGVVHRVFFHQGIFATVDRARFNKIDPFGAVVKPAATAGSAIADKSSVSPRLQSLIECTGMKLAEGGIKRNLGLSGISFNEAIAFYHELLNYLMEKANEKSDLGNYARALHVLQREILQRRSGTWFFAKVHYQQLWEVYRLTAGNDEAGNLILNSLTEILCDTRIALQGIKEDAARVFFAIKFIERANHLEEAGVDPLKSMNDVLNDWSAARLEFHPYLPPEAARAFVLNRRAGGSVGSRDELTHVLMSLEYVRKKMAHAVWDARQLELPVDLLIDNNPLDICRLFGEDALARLSIMRSLCPFTVSAFDRRPPWQFAQEEEWVFHWGDGISLTPVTESFRRHLVVLPGTMAGEVLIPGQNTDRKDTGVESRIKISREFINERRAHPLCPLPLSARAFPHGVYELYGLPNTFGVDRPLKIMVYDYPADGKRMDLVNPAYYDFIADNSGIGRKELRLMAVNNVAELTAFVHRKGLIGHTPKNSYALNLSNFRIVTNGSKPPFVMFAGDFRALTEERMFHHPAAERQKDIHQIETALNTTMWPKVSLPFGKPNFTKLVTAYYASAAGSAIEGDGPTSRGASPVSQRTFLIVQMCLVSLKSFITLEKLEDVEEKEIARKPLIEAEAFIVRSYGQEIYAFERGLIGLFDAVSSERSFTRDREAYKWHQDEGHFVEHAILLFKRVGFKSAVIDLEWLNKIASDNPQERHELLRVYLLGCICGFGLFHSFAWRQIEKIDFRDQEKSDDALVLLGMRSLTNLFPESVLLPYLRRFFDALFYSKHKRILSWLTKNGFESYALCGYASLLEIYKKGEPDGWGAAGIREFDGLVKDLLTIRKGLSKSYPQFDGMLPGGELFKAVSAQTGGGQVSGLHGWTVISESEYSTKEAMESIIKRIVGIFGESQITEEVLLQQIKGAYDELETRRMGFAPRHQEFMLVLISKFEGYGGRWLEIAGDIKYLLGRDLRIRGAIKTARGVLEAIFLFGHCANTLQDYLRVLKTYCLLQAISSEYPQEYREEFSRHNELFGKYIRFFCHFGASQCFVKQMAQKLAGVDFTNKLLLPSAADGDDSIPVNRPTSSPVLTRAQEEGRSAAQVRSNSMAGSATEENGPSVPAITPIKGSSPIVHKHNYHNKGGFENPQKLVTHDWLLPLKKITIPYRYLASCEFFLDPALLWLAFGVKWLYWPIFMPILGIFCCFNYGLYSMNDWLYGLSLYWVFGKIVAMIFLRAVTRDIISFNLSHVNAWQFVDTYIRTQMYGSVLKDERLDQWRQYWKESGVTNELPLKAIKINWGGGLDFYLDNYRGMNWYAWIIYLLPCWFEHLAETGRKESRHFVFERKPAILIPATQKEPVEKDMQRGLQSHSAATSEAGGSSAAQARRRQKLMIAGDWGIRRLGFGDWEHRGFGISQFPNPPVSKSQYPSFPITISSSAASGSRRSDSLKSFALRWFKKFIHAKESTHNGDESWSDKGSPAGARIHPQLDIAHSYRVIGVHLDELSAAESWTHERGDKVLREAQKLFGPFRHKLEIKSSRLFQERVKEDWLGWLYKSTFGRYAEFFTGTQYISFGFNVIACMAINMKSIALYKTRRNEPCVFHVFLFLSGAQPYFCTDDFAGILKKYHDIFKDDIRYELTFSGGTKMTTERPVIQDYVVIKDGFLIHPTSMPQGRVLTAINFCSNFDQFMRSREGIIKQVLHAHETGHGEVPAERGYARSRNEGDRTAGSSITRNDLGDFNLESAFADRESLQRLIYHGLLEFYYRELNDLAHGRGHGCWFSIAEQIVKHNETIASGFEAFSGFKVVDFGSGDGVFISRYRHMYPHHQIVGFEPQLPGDFALDPRLIYKSAFFTLLKTSSVNRVTINMPYPFTNLVYEFVKEAGRILAPRGEVIIVFQGANPRNNGEIQSIGSERNFISDCLKQSEFEISNGWRLFNQIGFPYPVTTCANNFIHNLKYGCHVIVAMKKSHSGVIWRPGRQVVDLEGKAQAKSAAAGSAVGKEFAGSRVCGLAGSGSSASAGPGKTETSLLSRLKVARIIPINSVQNIDVNTAEYRRGDGCWQPLIAYFHSYRTFLFQYHTEFYYLVKLLQYSGLLRNTGLIVIFRDRHADLEPASVDDARKQCLESYALSLCSDTYLIPLLWDGTVSRLISIVPPNDNNNRAQFVGKSTALGIRLEGSQWKRAAKTVLVGDITSFDRESYDRLVPIEHIYEKQLPGILSQCLTGNGDISRTLIDTTDGDAFFKKDERGRALCVVDEQYFRDYVDTQMILGRGFANNIFKFFSVSSYDPNFTPLEKANELVRRIEVVRKQSSERLGIMVGLGSTGCSNDAAGSAVGKEFAGSRVCGLAGSGSSASAVESHQRESAGPWFPMALWEKNYRRVLEQTFYNIQVVYGSEGNGISGVVYSTYQRKLLLKEGNVEERKKLLADRHLLLVNEDGRIVSKVKRISQYVSLAKKSAVQEFQESLSRALREKKLAIVELWTEKDGTLTLFGNRLGIIPGPGNSLVRIFLTNGNGRYHLRGYSRYPFDVNAKLLECVYERYTEDGDLLDTLLGNAHRLRSERLTGFVVGLESRDGGIPTPERELFNYTPYQNTRLLVWRQAGWPIRAMDLQTALMATSLERDAFDRFIRVEFKREEGAEWELLMTLKRRTSESINRDQKIFTETLNAVEAKFIRVRFLRTKRSQDNVRYVSFYGDYKITRGSLAERAPVACEYSIDRGQSGSLRCTLIRITAVVGTGRVSLIQVRKQDGTVLEGVSRFMSPLSDLSAQNGRLVVDNKPVFKSGVISFPYRRKIALVSILGKAATGRFITWFDRFGFPVVTIRKNKEGQIDVHSDVYLFDTMRKCRIPQKVVGRVKRITIPVRYVHMVDYIKLASRSRIEESHEAALDYIRSRGEKWLSSWVPRIQALKQVGPYRKQIIILICSLKDAYPARVMDAQKGVFVAKEYSLSSHQGKLLFEAFHGRLPANNLFPWQDARNARRSAFYFVYNRLPAEVKSQLFEKLRAKIGTNAVQFLLDLDDNPRNDDVYRIFSRLIELWKPQDAWEYQLRHTAEITAKNWGQTRAVVARELNVSDTTVRRRFSRIWACLSSREGNAAYCRWLVDELAKRHQKQSLEYLCGEICDLFPHIKPAVSRTAKFMYRSGERRRENRVFRNRNEAHPPTLAMLKPQDYESLISLRLLFKSDFLTLGRYFGFHQQQIKMFFLGSPRVRYEYPGAIQIFDAWLERVYYSALLHKEIDRVEAKMKDVTDAIHGVQEQLEEFNRTFGWEMTDIQQRLKDVRIPANGLSILPPR